MLVLFTHLQIIDANPPIGFLLPVVNLTRRRGGWKHFFSLSLRPNSPAAAPYLAHERLRIKAGAAIPSG